MRKPAKIRTYAFLPHDLSISFSATFRLSPISAKNAWGVSATGFTQKRHTLYPYYNGRGGKFQMFFTKNRRPKTGADLRILPYLTYSITTRRLGSTPVEWVVMFSMSCRAAWITWRS